MRAQAPLLLTGPIKKRRPPAGSDAVPGGPTGLSRADRAGDDRPRLIRPPQMSAVHA
jgi:hypothetical protein